MLIFGWALSGGDVPSYNIAVVDSDGSPVSASFIDEALSKVATFDIKRLDSADDALAQLKLGDIRPL